MFTQISTQIVTDLKASADLIGLLSNGVDSIYPLLADEDEGSSFITYTVKDKGQQAKDGVREFTIVIESWSDGYNESVAIADKVLDAIVSSENRYTYNGGMPYYYKEEIYYTEQEFTILK